MRDILFRAKDLDGKWVYGGITDPCHEIENKTYIVSIDFNRDEEVNCFIEVKEDTVCQFTGLTAKKVKSKLEPRIFEYDIFRHTKETDEGDVVGYSVVMWIVQYAAFYLIPVEHYEVVRDNDVSDEKEFSWLFEDALLRDFSIDVTLTKVGNVFDNTELLK